MDGSFWLLALPHGLSLLTPRAPLDVHAGRPIVLLFTPGAPSYYYSLPVSTLHDMNLARRDQSSVWHSLRSCCALVCFCLLSSSHVYSNDNDCVCGAGYFGDGGTCTVCSVNAADATDSNDNDCACNTGYSGDGASCGDIDECADGSDSCNQFQTCVNTNGSFSCGLLNECTTSDAAFAHNCHNLATCEDTTSGFSCECNFGYNGDGVTCTDVNECALSDPSPWGACSQLCANSAGGYECSCNTGYVLSGRTACDDINECLDDSANTCCDNCDANTDASSTCSNIAGGFTCACDTGYEGDGVSCTDINECSTGADSCSAFAQCFNTDGSFRCACNDGYSGGGVSCTDVDECADESLNTCDANTECSGVDGSFQCTCVTGWGLTQNDTDTLAATGRQSCTDKIGCAANPCINGVCADNSNGDGFTCDCAAPTFTGYQGVLCNENADECTAAGNLHDCNVEASCSDIDGSFTCQCNAGWTGTGTTCGNIDECSRDIDNCHQFATCADTDGSFSCECNGPTYEGDGVACQLATAGFRVQRVNAGVEYMGTPVAIRVIAVDHFDNLQVTEQRDVVLSFDGSALYRNEDLVAIPLDIVNGSGIVYLEPPIAGAYGISMDAGAERRRSHGALFSGGFTTLDIRVGVNASFLPSPGPGQGTVTANIQLGGVDCSGLSTAFTAAFARQFSAFILNAPIFSGTFATAFPSAIVSAADGGVLLSIDNDNIQFSTYYGFRHSNFAGRDFTAALMASDCTATNQGGLYRDPNSDMSDTAENQHTVLVRCDGRGVCAGSATSNWQPSMSALSGGLSMVLYDGATLAGNKMYCADISGFDKASALTINNMYCGGAQNLYLGAPLGTPSTTPANLGVNFSFTVPDSLATQLIADLREEPFAVADLIDYLRQDSELASFFDGTADVSNNVLLSREGVDCNAGDGYGNWSACSQPCANGLEGTKFRVRQCSYESEIEPCFSALPCPTAASCSFNNGDCHSDATCSIDSSVVHSHADPLIANCSCNANFLGDGRDCIPSETNVAEISLEYTDSMFFTKVPSQTDQRDLLGLIIASFEAVGGVSGAGRIFSPMIFVGTDTDLSVSFGIASRTFASQALACDVAATLVAALNSTASIQTTFGWGAGQTSIIQPTQYAVICPAALATFTTTVTTATSVTATSVTTANPTANPTKVPTSATLTTQTLTTQTSRTQTSTTTIDPSLAANSATNADDNSWGEEETLFLISALLIVFTILMIVGMVCAVKQNSRSKLLELGLMFPDQDQPGKEGPGSPYQSKLEGGPGEESKWMQDPESPSHYRPAATSIGSPNSILG